MKIDTHFFRVPPGAKVDLDQWPTRVKPCFESKEDYQRLLDTHVARLSSLQHVHYASGRYAVLLIVQGMDTAGKDGVIQHVLSGVNPEGCDVVSFKEPSVAELKHDFLWRTACRLPERGRIGVFNRSYYEEVLIARVHPAILDTQNLPKRSRDEKHFWADRYRSIVDWEAHLQRNGTQIIKIFLHVSKHEQKKRFLERIDDPDKNWKFSRSDIHERQYWSRYKRAYAKCLQATSSRHAPWHAVPADDKENARLIVSTIVIDVVEGLHMAYPKTGLKRRRELLAIRRELLTSR